MSTRRRIDGIEDRQAAIYVSRARACLFFSAFCFIVLLLAIYASHAADS